MFRKVTKLVHPCREKILSLALVPAFLLSTLPHTACICADGHREPSCQAAACRFLAHGSSAMACCGCSCCQNRDAGEARSCCRVTHAQPVQSGQTPTSGMVATSGCCHPIIEAPAPAVAVGKVDLAARQKLVSLVEFAPPVTWAGNVRPTVHRMDSTGPPPLDAVIVFQRLTI